MKKEELKNYLEGFSFSYDYEEDYSNIYNACTDYMNDTQDFSIEYAFEDVITYDTAEEIAKRELEDGGLIRLYYFLGTANLNNDIFLLDGYGNLQDATKEDLQNIIDTVLEELES